MDYIDSLDKVAKELAGNIKKLSDRIKILGDGEHDPSITIGELDRTCKELERVNEEIKKILT